MGHLAKPGAGRFTVAFVTTHGWGVFSPDGERVGCWHPARNLALSACGTWQAAADRAKNRVSRPCMCCTHPFESEGIHNRLCAHCKTGQPRVPFIDRKRA